MAVLSVCVRAVMLLVMQYAMLFFLRLQPPLSCAIGTLTKKRSTVYLTQIFMLMQVAYFGLAVANDVFGSDQRRPSKQHRLQRIRDWCFTSLVFPVGQFVSFMFWTLYLINRELILPLTMDEWFPGWLNHIMHTLPMVAGLAEQVLVYHTHQRGHSRLLPLVSLYAVYLAWFMYVRIAGGFWIYPLFNLLSSGEIGVFLGLMSVPALFAFVAGERIHVAVWGLEPSSVETEEKEKLR